MRTRAWPDTVAVWALGLALSCERQQPCTLIALKSISVTLIDADSGVRVCAAELRVTLDGEPIHLRHDATECSRHDIEGTGTYSVVAEAPGYASSTSEVFVDSDGCHPVPQALEVRLERNSGSN